MSKRFAEKRKLMVADRRYERGEIPCSACVVAAWASCIPSFLSCRVRAIATAAANLKKEGLDPKPEVMIPLVSTVKELEKLRKVAVDTINEVAAEAGVELDIPVGNDQSSFLVPLLPLKKSPLRPTSSALVPTTSLRPRSASAMRRRGRVRSSSTLPRSFSPYNPFATIDPGVAKLVKMGVEFGHEGNPDLVCGVCGEHGGDSDLRQDVPQDRS